MISACPNLGLILQRRWGTVHYYLPFLYWPVSDQAESAEVAEALRHSSQRSLWLPANLPVLFTKLQNRVLGKPATLRTGSSAAGLECVQKPLKHRDIPRDNMNLRKENFLCNQPLTKWPKPHTWTLNHRLKLQISTSQVQLKCQWPGLLSILSDKGIKPLRCNQLPILSKEDRINGKNFKWTGFLEHNQSNIWSFIAHLFRERLEILSGNVKKVLRDCMALNRNLSFWLTLILFAASENEMLLANTHRTALTKKPPNFCPFILTQFLDTTE